MGEEVFFSAQNHLLESYGESMSSSLAERIGILLIDENGSLKDDKGKILLQYNQDAKWEYGQYWQEFEENKSDFSSILKEKGDVIRSKSQDLTDFSLASELSVFVVLPTYSLVESTFLTWLLAFFKENKTLINPNLFFVGLLPETNDACKNDPISFQRTFACLSECDLLMTQQQDLLNLFCLISNKNEKEGLFIENPRNIQSVVKSFLLSIFKGEIEKLHNNRRVSLPVSQGKLGLFSAIGFSAYVYKKKHILNLFDEKVHLKIVDGLKSYLDTDLNFRNISTEVDGFSVSLNLNDKQKLLEEIPFKQFSENNKFDTNNTTEVLFSQINEAKEKHSSSIGYFKSTYLPQLEKSLSEKVKSTSTALLGKVRENFEKDGIVAFNKSLAFLYLICGKHPDMFKGEIEQPEFNFSLAKFNSSDHFRGFLPEEESKIFSSEFLETERNLKNKLTIANDKRKEIAILEKRIYGYNEPLVNIKDQDRSNMFFNINGVDVSINGLIEDIKEVPSFITPYNPALSEKPANVDLRPFMTPVENQLGVSSCSANAVVSNYEYFINRVKNESKDFSRLFVYYNARKMSDGEIEDNGSAIVHCIESTMHENHGVCLENTWPYNVHTVNSKPVNKAYEEAKEFLVTEASTFDVELEAMKSCLAEGYPFVFGLKLFNSFQCVGSTGIVPIPEAEESNLDVHGLHAMLCVGYSESDRYFIVKNSWGSDWAHNGYCYIPFDYLGNKDFHCSKLFFVKKIGFMDKNEKEIDFKKGISTHNSTLFTVGEDQRRLNLLKEEFAKIDSEIQLLQQNFENLKYEFEKQNSKVLSNEFLNEVREKELNQINGEIEGLKKDLLAVDQQLLSTKGEIDLLLEKKSKFIRNFFFVVPALLVLAMGIAYFQFHNVFGTELLLKLFTLSGIAYLIFALVAYQIRINRPGKILQTNLSELEIRRLDLMGVDRGILKKTDEYFDKQRSFELHKFYLEFVANMDSIVNDKLIAELEKWKGKINQHQQDSISRINQLELSDSFNVKYAINKDDVDKIVSKVDSNKLYLKDGNLNLKQFLYDSSDELNAQDGIDSLLTDINKYSSQCNENYILSELNILDFLVGNELLEQLPIQLGLKGDDAVLAFLNASSKTLLSIYNEMESAELIKKLSLSIPETGTEVSYKIIKHVESICNDVVEPTDTNNNNDLESSISFLRIEAMLPAYSISSLQEAKRVFDKLSESEKKKFFVSQDLAALPLFPENYS